ncbi:nickel-dependent hydrogenase large subunit [Patescibacteria group bacterium]|nr:nickel-dependent hydrogenase large subunit [Patescibacteria group bacterium]
MHQSDFKLNIKEITKVEGSAELEVKVVKSKVKYVKFKIKDFKRFYTQAIQGKSALAVPQMLARICGTCSNAHLMASIEAIEKACDFKPSIQTMVLRKLAYHGLIIRDHALHLYVFVLPDLFNKDSLLDFDENNQREHQFLHDTFKVKSAGNNLSIFTAGRSVHSPYPVVGGFLKTPAEEKKQNIIEKLEQARPAVLRLINIYKNSKFNLIRKTDYVCLKANPFSYLEGQLYNQNKLIAEEKDFRQHFEHVVLPYSQASAYTFKGKPYQVGALARININQQALHDKTKKSATSALKSFPSNNIYHNNLAQAIEILHSIDESIDLLNNFKFKPEEPTKLKIKKSIGIGVIEAPRGTLYHKLEIDNQGIIKKGEVIVPTGQNQLSIELDIAEFIQNNIDMDQAQLSLQCEKIIRAYDPCMSCASHFLKLNLTRK